MIIYNCIGCQKFFFADGQQTKLSLYQQKILTECNRIEEKECTECAERRRTVERFNVATSLCGAIGLDEFGM